MSAIGKPARIPPSSASTTPFSIAGMNSFGILPPLISFSNSNPLPGFGSTRSLVRAYWPLPPVCFLWRVIGFRRLADGLAIRHLRLADVGRHAEFAHHAVHDDFQVQFAHSRKNRLAGFRIGIDAEGGIFLRQFLRSPCPSFPGRPWSSAPPRAESPASGNRSISSTIGWSSSQMVSPVEMVFSPTAAQISPARIS